MIFRQKRSLRQLGGRKMKGKTNYEVIHSMSTEQLSEFLACFWSRDMVPKRYNCDLIHPCLGCPENYICFREWLERPCTDAMFKKEKKDE